MMKVSLIVTSNERVEDFRRFLKSAFSCLRDGEVQLIFINQGFCTLNNEFNSDERLEYIIVNINKVISLSSARNIGLKYATGDVVAFPDDDCWYAPDLLDRVVTYFTNNPTIDCLCTNVYDPEKNLSYGKRPLDVIVRVSFMNLFKLPISVGIFVRASAMKKAGRYFDERLGAGSPLGSGEETDLVARLLTTGCRVIYNGYIRVFHPVPEYVESDVLKYYRYGRGFGYLNGLLVRRRCFTVLWGWFSVLLRSLGGVVFNLHNPILTRLYAHRFKGVWNGFWEGVRSL